MDMIEVRLLKQPSVGTSDSFNPRCEATRRRRRRRSAYSQQCTRPAGSRCQARGDLMRPLAWPRGPAADGLAGYRERGGVENVDVMPFRRSNIDPGYSYKQGGVDGSAPELKALPDSSLCEARPLFRAPRTNWTAAYSWPEKNRRSSGLRRTCTRPARRFPPGQRKAWNYLMSGPGL
jgi:hypothetical protein